MKSATTTLDGLGLLHTITDGLVQRLSEMSDSYWSCAKLSAGVILVQRQRQVDFLDHEATIGKVLVRQVGSQLELEVQGGDYHDWLLGVVSNLEI